MGVGKKLKPLQRPIFHEIRSLGADLYRKAGPKMTRTYLDRRGLDVKYADTAAGLVVKPA